MLAGSELTSHFGVFFLFNVGRRKLGYMWLSEVPGWRRITQSQTSLTPNINFAPAAHSAV